MTPTGRQIATSLLLIPTFLFLLFGSRQPFGLVLKESLFMGYHAHILNCKAPHANRRSATQPAQYMVHKRTVQLFQDIYVPVQDGDINVSFFSLS